MEQVGISVLNPEKPETKNVEVAEVSPEERALFLGCLADEFIPPSQRSDFIEKVQICLLTPPSK